MYEYNDFVAGLNIFKMATLTEQASKLLDFGQKLDITLLDTVVGCMYTGIGDQVYFYIINI